MKSKFLFISILLILALSIGAVSAADIGDANDSNSDSSIASPVDSVDGDGFDYAGDSIDTNDSDSSDILGVGEEDDVISDGTGGSIVFLDAVDGVIVLDEVVGKYNDPNDQPNYEKYGYKRSIIDFNILDANGNRIDIVQNADWNVEYDGVGTAANGISYIRGGYDDYPDSHVTLLNILQATGLNKADEGYYKRGTHTFSIWSNDGKYNQSVTIVLVDPNAVPEPQSQPKIVFPDAVDGVITFNQLEAAPWNPSQRDYDTYGYMYNTINFDILDVNGNRINVDYNDWRIEYDGHSAEGDEEYADLMESIFYDYNADVPICLYSYMYATGLYDKDTYNIYLDEYCKIGNHTLTIYNTDGTYNQSVKIVMKEPKDVSAKVSIKDLITVDVTTDDGQGNFTVYVADNIVANGTVNANGTGSVSFEKIYGKNTLKVILDGATAKGLKYETQIDVVKFLPGSFSDLKEQIDNATGVLDLPYDFKLNPDEADAFKNGVLIENNITINANGFTINGTSVDGTSARIFDTANYVTVTINNANLVGGGVSGVNGGAIRATPNAHVILNNVTLTDNFGQSAGGAINLNSNAALTATNVTFKNNRVNNRGGAIFANSNTNLNLTNVVFDSNSAKGNGGNLFIGSNSNAVIENATFTNFYMKANSVSGGAIYVESSSNVAISDSLFENITVEMQSDGDWWDSYSNNGGVIHCDDTVILNITGSTFKNNRNINTRSQATSRGTIFSTGSNAYSYITDCVFINNSAQQTGAIYTRNADIIGCIFDDNSGTNDNPEIYYEGSGKGTISHNVFLDDNTVIRIRNNAANVVETTNWWASNNPGNLVRIENNYVAPNNYIVMSVFNEGNTAYGALIRNSLGDFIENPELVPVRTAIFESSQTTSADTVDAIASAEVTDSQVNITIDGVTMTLFMAPGNITDIQVVGVENTNVGADGKVYIVLTGDNGPVDGILTVMSNDHSYDVEVSNGSAIAEFGGDFDAGEYDIYYVYEGSANYAATSTKGKAEQKLVVSKNDVTITIDRLKNIITFNVAGENGIVPTGTINATVGGINKVFTLSNGAASYNYGLDLGSGVYDVNVTYSGDKNNNEGILLTTFEILKCDVVITFTNVTNTLTFNVTGTDGLIATGKIIVTLGNSTQTLTLNNKGLASYDFGKVLPAGEFNLIANYTGDDYYNPGLMEDTFEIVKMTPTIELTISNINISQGDNGHFVIKVIGDENIATGYVNLMAGDTSIYRSSLRDGVRETNVGSGLKAGVYNITVIYEGDGYYYATNMTYNETLNVLPKITIKAPTEVYSEQAPLIISISPSDVDGVLIVKMDGVELFAGEIASGYLYLTLSNLEEGEHTFEAYYGGNDKYMPNSATVTTTVSYPELPQWGQQGYDYTNGGQSPYIRLNEVIELWNYEMDIGSSSSGATLLIDAEGNVYIGFNRKVTSLYADGSERWSYDDGSWGGLGGEVLDAYGHIIAPQKGNAFSYLETADGSCPTPWGLFYECSSSYAPVIGPDGVIYFNYEYSYPNSGWSSVTGDRRWIGLVDSGEGYDYGSYRGEGNSLVLIEGLSPGSQPHLAPVTLDNLGNLWHTSTSGLRGVAIGTNTIVFQDANIGTKGRAVVDANNIVYVFGGEDQIFAVNAGGILWNTTVTDGSGSTMVVGKDSEYILSINSEGVLYKYDVTDGKETKIYDFETTVSSALMTDANGIIYVGDDDGMFWALTDDGTVLWTFDAGSAITARPVMDKNGVIYIYTADNVLYALGFNKENSTISLEVNDTTTVDGLTAIATVNENATGEVKFILNGNETYNVKIIDGAATLFLDTIFAGDYNITAIYGGNYIYNGNEASASFKVKSETVLIVSDLVTAYHAADEFYAVLNDVYGNPIADAEVRFVIGGMSIVATTNSMGSAYMDTNTLNPGNYTAYVTYDGGEYYFSSNATANVVVNKMGTVLVADDVVVNYGNDGELVAVLTDALGNPVVGGKVKFIVGDITHFIWTDSEGKVCLNISSLSPGNYTARIRYLGNNNYINTTTTAKVTVNKGDSLLSADNVAVKYGNDGELVAVLTDTAGNPIVGGKVKFIVGDITHFIWTDSEGKVSLNISSLSQGNYTARIRYLGNDKYLASKTTANVYIYGKMETQLSAADVAVKYGDDGELVAVLTDTAGNAIVGGKVKFIVGDITHFVWTDSEGKVSLNISSLSQGNYTARIRYLGNDNYLESKTNANVFVYDTIETQLSAADVDVKYGDDGKLVAVLTDTAGNPIVGGKVKFIVGDITHFVWTDSEGKACLNISSLSPGSYTARIRYLGNDMYLASKTTANVIINSAV